MHAQVDTDRSGGVTQEELRADWARNDLLFLDPESFEEDDVTDNEDDEARPEMERAWGEGGDEAGEDGEKGEEAGEEKETDDDDEVRDSVDLRG